MMFPAIRKTGHHNFNCLLAFFFLFSVGKLKRGYFNPKTKKLYIAAYYVYLPTVPDWVGHSRICSLVPLCGRYNIDDSARTALLSLSSQDSTCLCRSGRERRCPLVLISAAEWSLCVREKLGVCLWSARQCRFVAGEQSQMNLLEGISPQAQLPKELTVCCVS